MHLYELTHKGKAGEVPMAEPGSREDYFHGDVTERDKFRGLFLIKKTS
jgi:hypothetical protein